jgi:hypothetical protein
MGNSSSTPAISPGGPPLNTIEKEIMKDINRKNANSIQYYQNRNVKNENIRKEIFKLLLENSSDIGSYDLKKIIDMDEDENYDLFFTAYNKFKDSNEGKSNSSYSQIWIIEMFSRKKFDLLKILISEHGFTNRLIYRDESNASVHPKIIELLQDLNVNDLRYANKYLPGILDIFTYAVLYGDYDILKFLTENSFKPHEAFEENMLFFAIIGKNSDSLKFLFDYGGYQNKINELIEGRITPLILATRLDDLECVKILLSKKADVNIDDSDNKDALSYAKPGSPIFQALRDTLSSNNYQANDIQLKDEIKASEFSLPEEDLNKYKFKAKYRLIPADPNIRPIPFKISYAIIPTNLELYRGVSISCTDVKLETDSDKKYVYFTHKRFISEGYSKGQCVVTYKAKRDLILLDLWTASIWDYINTLLKKHPNGKTYSDILNKFNGTSIELEQSKLAIPDYLDSVARSFPTGKVLQDSFVYRNLKWGPKLGQFKRSSSYKTDYDAIDVLIKLFPNIDGFYLTETPSYNHGSVYDDDNTKVRKNTFHSEIILTRPYINKIEFVSKTIGGKRRKTYRKKNKKRKTIKRKSTSY